MDQKRWKSIRNSKGPMNKYLFGISCFTAAMMITGAAVAADKIIVAADSWMPFTGEEGAARQGFCVDIVKAVFEPAGYEVQYQSRAWTRDVEDVKTGAADILLGAGRTDCPRCLFPEKPVAMVQNFYYVKKGDPWTFDRISSLVNRRLGVIDGYSYDDGVLDAYIKVGEVPDVQRAVGTNALSFNINKLLAGRLDTIVENDLVMKNKLGEIAVAADRIVPAGQANEAQAVYAAFTPEGSRSPELMALWTKGFAQLRASGKLAEILAKYGVTDWEAVAAPVNK